MQAMGIALDHLVTMILIEHPAGGWFFYSWERRDGRPLWAQPTPGEKIMRFVTPDAATDYFRAQYAQPESAAAR